MATQSLKSDGWKKNGTVDSVRRTFKLCSYSNTLNVAMPFLPVMKAH